MTRRTEWFPAIRVNQTAMFTNIKTKIGGYKSTLNLTDEQIERIDLICDIFIKVANYVEHTRITAKSVTDWQELIFTGSPAGAIPPIAPTFQTISLPEEAFIGIFDAFRELIEIIKSSRSYNQTIGRDLMITGEIDEPDLSKLFPVLKIQTLSGYRVRIESSLQEMDAMRVEYHHKRAQNWQPIAFLTKFPAEIKFTPIVNGEPEMGQLRAVLVKNNENVGQFSLHYPVVIS